MSNKMRYIRMCIAWFERMDRQVHKVCMKDSFTKKIYLRVHNISMYMYPKGPTRNPLRAASPPPETTLSPTQREVRGPGISGKKFLRSRGKPRRMPKIFMKQHHGMRRIWSTCI